MLLQFTVENFLSFDEATTLSMRANEESDHALHLIKTGQQKVVKGAAIYGANAAGKSNLVLAMAFARDLIVQGRGLHGAIAVRPFGLNKNATRTSGFHWQFVHAGQLWSYGFDVTARAIVAEYLFSSDSDGASEQMWFERTTDENGVTSLTFGPRLNHDGDTRLTQRLEIIAENLRAPQPFLTHAIENRVRELGAVWQWFDEALLILRSEETVRNLVLSLDETATLVDFAGELLRFADTGIEELILEKMPISDQDVFDDVAEENWQVIEETFATEMPRCYFDFTRDSGPVGIECDDEGNFWDLRFKARHSESSKEAHFPIEWESEGTRRLLQLAPALFLLRCDPIVLVVDELDRRLHSLLVREVVKLGLGRESQGQLIFTAHDTNLLDAWLLRRDEIWFMDKNAAGASGLSCLAQWEIEPGLNYEKAYLLGMFDGRPHFHFSPLLRGLPDSEGARDSPTEAELKTQIADLPSQTARFQETG